MKTTKEAKRVTIPVRTILPLLLLISSCTGPRVREFVTTTYDAPWEVQDCSALPPEDAEPEFLSILSPLAGTGIEGFGTCFNELGWASLSLLGEEDRTRILSELFTPGQGANLTMARMPIGANDFSVDYYSYDDTEGDFELRDFSISRDERLLIPFIKAALGCNPSLRIWASPWCPPQWMKVSGHYAGSSTRPLRRGYEEFKMMQASLPEDQRTEPENPYGLSMAHLPDNGLEEDRQIPEGKDAFRLEEKYLHAYAQYFGKFIDEYRARGIDIFMVMPQNEPNSAQFFPSCTWTPQGLASLVRHVGPEMKRRGVEVYLGTMERADPSLWKVILDDPEASGYISGMGFQWAGKDALAPLHREYPDLPCYQTEQECGNGRNDWQGALHSWDLMKHYLGGGVSAYFYWNTSLLEGGVSTWGWCQNSLVVVDKDKRTYRWTPEYYVLKHASHFIAKGAELLGTGGYGDVLAFRNPGGETVIIIGNSHLAAKTVTVKLGGKEFRLYLKPSSLSTVVIG